ncbi:MAG TPA: hypothetical protein VFS67_30685 [Polyangiaceae bacterium]|nr:hypothetical protein [Polyangiaceae bacterium]
MNRALNPTESSAFARLWQAYGHWPKSSRERKQAHLSSLSDADLLALRIDESRSDVGEVTRICLCLAVPMWIDKMRWWRAARREQLAHELGEEIAASHVLVADDNPEGRVPSSERGTVALGFNRIAQGLALLAFCPGGVVFAGEHWQAQPGALPAEAD